MVERFLSQTLLRLAGGLPEEPAHTGSGEFQFRLRRGGRIRRRAARQGGAAVDRRPGRRNPVHLCRHQARKRPHGLVFPEPRHRKGRCGDADPQAPLRVLVLDSGAAQAGRGGDPGDPPADQKGRCLPLQYGRDQGHRRGGRAGDHRSHRGGHARKPHHRTARQRGSRGPRRVSRFPRRHRNRRLLSCARSG